MLHAPTLPLLPLLVERVWGRRNLEDWVGITGTPNGRPIGEVWLTDVTCATADGETLASSLASGRATPPLLAKLLFTAAPLSVQVHPTDAAAAAAGMLSGKDEAWHVLEALPDAMVWLGFRHPVAAPALRAAASDGSILTLMRSHAAKPGETILVPSGTVHAIGAGLVILEVQDAVDITYRLYDYGRPRPLQVEAALSVADFGCSRVTIHAPAEARPARQLLATAPRFVLERCAVSAGVKLKPDGHRDHIIVALTDFVTLDGHALARGMAAFIPAAGCLTRIAGAPGAAVALLHDGPGSTPCIVID